VYGSGKLYIICAYILLISRSGIKGKKRGVKKFHPQAGVYVNSFVHRHSDLKQIFVLFMIRSNKRPILVEPATKHRQMFTEYLRMTTKAGKGLSHSAHRKERHCGEKLIFSDRRPELYTTTAYILISQLLCPNSHYL
jgi:hypothetical protein